MPAFLEGFDAEIYSFGADYIVPSITGPAYLSIGTILTGYAIGIAIFSLVGGYFFDRYSVKNTILLSVLIFSAFTVLTGFVTNTPELFAFRLLVGVGVGMFQPAGVALLGDIFFETRGKAVSVWATFFGAGLFGGPYMISPFLPAFRIPFELSGIVSAIVLLLVLFIIPVTYKKEKREKIKLENIFNRNTVLLAISVFFFGITLFAGYLSYYVKYLEQGLGFPTGSAAVIASMAGLGGFLLAFFYGYIADRIGRKYMVIITSFLIFIGSLGMFILFKSFIGLAVFTFIFGSGWGVYVDLLVAFGQDSVLDRVVGSVSGFLFFIFNIGTLIGGPLYAYLLGSKNNYTFASYIAVVIPAFIALISLIFTKKITKSNIKEHPEFEEAKIREKSAEKEGS
ncbi:MFS transporter [Acidiplasma sp.]|uniref:MFS transporter n=1 Tax=Acidiplasma sp. TaxID=1872114 RepID=UPI0025826765|nr:MFS transporter [Acidiplasma sp.]